MPCTAWPTAASRRRATRATPTAPGWRSASRRRRRLGRRLRRQHRPDDDRRQELKGETGAVREDVEPGIDRRGEIGPGIEERLRREDGGERPGAAAEPEDGQEGAP